MGRGPAPASPHPAPRRAHAAVRRRAAGARPWHHAGAHRRAPGHVPSRGAAPRPWHVAHLDPLQSRLPALMQPDETRRLLDELEAVTARLQDVEAALREQAEGRSLSRVRKRLRAWSAPRLGGLRQHPPEPLLVPTSYLRTDPPSPAPRISIVTPSLRQGQFIERTIYSVLSQGYPDLEHVVQDGGSDDGTLDLLRRYDGALASWASEPDTGQADAINRGF